MSHQAPRILLVDDEQSVQKLLSFPLKREGYDVVPAQDGQEALDRLSESTFDLVVLDLMLPKVDGFEVCRRLRARSRRPSIMRTAHAAESDKVLGHELGAHDNNTKPVQKGDEDVRLTYVEFEILAALARNPGRVYSRTQLLERVWGDSAYRDPRTVDVHIRHLREKLEADPREPELILTVRGVGYRFGER